MSYDMGSHGLAQRYFIQALRLAQAGDDVLLAGSILDAMSHQATFLGRFGEAANLARAAGVGTGHQATATLRAHFAAMEARSLAAAGDCLASERALTQAVHLFEIRHPDDDPPWISYFDEAELSAELAHSYRDLGRAEQAESHAQRALEQAGTCPRSDFFVMMVLAAAQLRRRDVDEACDTARRALTIGAAVKSARTVEYLRQFRRELAPYESAAAVLALSMDSGQEPLWQEAS
jgi:tetratricopeptide (TPR) repeat protein